MNSMLNTIFLILLFGSSINAILHKSFLKTTLAKNNFNNGDIITIKSNHFKNIYLRLDGSNCNDNNKICGNVNAHYGATVGEKFVLMKSDNDSFCLYSLKFPLVFLKFDPSSCKIFSGPGCGKVTGYYGASDTSCPDGTKFKLLFSNSKFIISSVENPKAYLRLDGNGVNTSHNNGSGSVNGQFFNNINQVPSNGYEIYQINVVDNITNKLKNLALKHSPYFFINRSEQHFPVSIESLKVNWLTDDQLKNPGTKVEYNYNAGKSFNNTAPLYVSFTRKSNGFNINYGVLFAYNDCGPHASITAKAISNIGTIGVNDVRIYLCPGGVHNGDFEHVSINFSSENFNIRKLYYGYHSWEKELNINNVEWDNTHPIVYMAKGSHALYFTKGEQKYLKLWEEKDGKNSKCPSTCNKDVSIPYPCGVKMCKKFGVPYPCGVKTCYKTQKVPYPCLKDCWIGAMTEGWFIDFCPIDKDKKWTPPLRFIYSGVTLMDNIGLTKDEVNLAKFQGRFGADIKNEGWSNFKKAILGITWVVREPCSKCNKSINSALDSGESEFQSEAPKSLATKDWWKQN